MNTRLLISLSIGLGLSFSASSQTSPTTKASDKAQSLFDSGFQKGPDRLEQMSEYAEIINAYCLKDGDDSEVIASYRELTDLAEAEAKDQRKELEMPNSSSDMMLNEKLLLKIEARIELLQRKKLRSADDVCEIRLEIEDLVDTFNTIKEAKNKKGDQK